MAKGTKRASIESRIFWLLLKAAVIAFALALPLLGAWTAASLAAYANGPRWVAFVCGLLGFPILPFAWEGWAQYRRKQRVAAFKKGRGKYVKPHILTLSDRIWMRTLAINLLFAFAVLGLRPEAGVRALQSRGDFMLDGAQSPTAARMRVTLHAIADAFDWLYRITHDNPYDDDNGKKKAKDDDGKPPPVRRGETEEVKDDGTDTTPKSDAGAPIPLADGGIAITPPPPKTDVTPPPPKPEDAIPTPDHLWPTASIPLPLALAIPKDLEATPESIGAYFKDKAPDELTRARAIHDYVADRVAYDVHSFTHRSERAPQDATTVLSRRMGVCEGYARLFVSIARAAGMEAEYVIGDAKGAGGEVDGAGHAWNAIKIGGKWYLVDATWDSGFLMNGAYEKHYTSEYFLTPAEIFGVDHYPQQSVWQLRAPVITRGDFMRAPQMRPRFFASGLALVRPDRSQITVQGSADLEVKKQSAGAPIFFLADWEANGKRGRCRVTDGESVQFHCELPSAGTYRLLLFQSPKKYGSYDFSGEIVALDSR